LLFGAKYLVLEPALRRNVDFDPERDFAPVALVSQTPFLLMVPASMPVKNVSELLAYARQHAGTLTYGSPGLGTGPHLLGEMLKAAAQVDIVHVPYKGGAPTIVDLVGGQISMALIAPSSGVPLIRNGKLRALAVTASRRLDALPDVPTVAEAGLPGLEFQAWFGVLVPARTPEEIVRRLNAAIVAIVKSADFTRAVESGGGAVIPSSPQEFAQRIRTDAAAIAEFVKANNLKIEE
jgi:tripartite-type tricarboxylate transporter receptor subunit TctC